MLFLRFDPKRAELRRESVGALTLLLGALTLLLVALPLLLGALTLLLGPLALLLGPLALLLGPLGAGENQRAILIAPAYPAGGESLICAVPERQAKTDRKPGVCALD